MRCIMKNKLIRTPYAITSNEDLEILFKILDDDVNKELTTKKLKKEYIKRKREVKREK